MEPTFFPSNRGGSKMMLDNYIYHKIVRSSGSIWRCEKRRQTGCCGAIISVDNKLKLVKEHDHDADEEYVKAEIAKARLYAAIPDISGSTSDVINLLSPDLSESAKNYLPKMKSVLRTLQRRKLRAARSNHRYIENAEDEAPIEVYDDFDPESAIFSSKRNGKKMSYRGYVYQADKYNKIEGSTWRCAVKQTLNCPASAKILGTTLMLMKKHNHEIDVDFILENAETDEMDMEVVQEYQRSSNSPVAPSSAFDELKTNVEKALAAVEYPKVNGNHACIPSEIYDKITDSAAAAGSSSSLPRTNRSATESITINGDLFSYFDTGADDPERLIVLCKKQFVPK